MRTHLRLARSGFAALLLASVAPLSAAHAQTADPDLTSKLLIEILVKKGVLSRADAQSILQEAQQAASVAQSAPPPAPAPTTTTVTVSSATAPDGTIHVTYIPQVVRDQIAATVKTQVMAQEQAQGYAAPDEVPDWIKHIKIHGDLRMRYESDLFPHGNDNTGAFPNFNSINTGSPYDTSTSNLNFPSQVNVDQNRNRFRLRARLGVDADLGDGFLAGLRIATGENDSPVSENQTLGGAPSGTQGGNFSKYAIWLDRAYIEYKPDIGPGNNLGFVAGRFDNPFLSTNLIFADDLGFDGVAVMAAIAMPFGLTPFINAGAFPIYNTDFSYASNQPAKYPSHDKYMFGAQGGTAWRFGDDYAAKIGVADYAFTDVAGKLSAPCTVLSASDQCSTDSDRPTFAQNGNTYMALRDIIPTTANNNGTINQYQYFGLASNFNVLSVAGRLDYGGLDPTHFWVTGEYVRNLAFNKTDIEAKAVNNRAGATTGTGSFAGGNTGYFANLSVGHQELLARWDWNASIGYKHVESDAVIDGLDDSDFGLGGTNLKGYIVGGNVALGQKVWVRLRYLSADSIAGPPYRADVFQLDLNAKF